MKEFTSIVEGIKKNAKNVVYRDLVKENEELRQHFSRFMSGPKKAQDVRTLRATEPKGTIWRLPNGYWRACNLAGSQCSFKLQTEALKFSHTGKTSQSNRTILQEVRQYVKSTRDPIQKKYAKEYLESRVSSKNRPVAPEILAPAVAQEVRTSIDRVLSEAVPAGVGGEGYYHVGDRVWEIRNRSRKGRILQVNAGQRAVTVKWDDGTSETLDWRKVDKAYNEAKSVVTEAIAWDVFLNGKEIDTVWSTEQNAEDMKRSLVNHDGYDPNIVVKMAKSSTRPARKPSQNEAKGMSVPDKHQLRIAKDTLKMNPVMARVMGGPSPEEAKEIIKRLKAKYGLKKEELQVLIKTVKEEVNKVVNEAESSYTAKAKGNGWSYSSTIKANSKGEAEASLRKDPRFRKTANQNDANWKTVPVTVDREARTKFGSKT